MFENLTNKFEEIFSSLKKAPSLDEKQVDEGLKGIRLALLEADVSLDVVKEFISRVKPKALGQEIIRSTSPGDMVVKIVYEEIVSFLVEGSHPHDVALLLDNRGISVRAGHHCAQPAMRHFNVDTTLRVSFGVYNNEEDLSLIHI